MVFLIQNTQNRDNDILHLKLNELIRATKDAQNAFLSLDHLDSKELRELRNRYCTMGEEEEVSIDCTQTASVQVADIQKPTALPPAESPRP